MQTLSIAVRECTHTANMQHNESVTHVMIYSFLNRHTELILLRISNNTCDQERDLLPITFNYIMVHHCSCRDGPI